MSSALTLASQTIGFISFSITLLTLLGVYSSLLGTLRSAPTQIPITLGNLRQEILAERSYLRQRCLEGKDPFDIFPGNLGSMPGRRGKGGGDRKGRKSTAKTDDNKDHDDDERIGGNDALAISEEGYARLLTYTIRDLWFEFQRLERPFLVKGGMRAEAIRRGDYWGQEDLDVEGGASESESSADEKGGARRRKRRRRRRRRAAAERGGPGHPEWEAAEEDLRREGAKYYNTGFTHRFIWWQTKDDVLQLADQVQRVQIRRMERDLFETDELVRMLVRERGIGGGGRRQGGRRRPSGGGGGDGRGNGSDSASEEPIRAGAIVRSRAGSRVPPSRRGSTAARNVREVDEVERVRRPARSPPANHRQADREANVAARRTDRRRSGSVVQYEVLRPSGGGSYVVIDNYQGQPSRGARVYEDEPRRTERRSSSRGRDGR